jgi:hypothetical protein
MPHIDWHNYIVHLHDFPLLATVLSGVAAYVLGIFWYHPKVLGNNWMEARNQQGSVFKPNGAALFYTFILWMLAATFYSFIIQLLGADSFGAYISVACLVWVAFAMPPMVMGALYTGYSFKAVAIDTGYQLAGYYLFALVHSALLMMRYLPLHHAFA